MGPYIIVQHRGHYGEVTGRGGGILGDVARLGIYPAFTYRCWGSLDLGPATARVLSFATVLQVWGDELVDRLEGVIIFFS